MGWRDFENKVSDVKKRAEQPGRTNGTDQTDTSKDSESPEC